MAVIGYRGRWCGNLRDVHASNHTTLAMAGDGAVEVDWVGVVHGHDEGLAADVEA